jgi:hypothetical protein
MIFGSSGGGQSGGHFEIGGVGGMGGVGEEDEHESEGKPNQQGLTIAKTAKTTNATAPAIKNKRNFLGGEDTRVVGEEYTGVSGGEDTRVGGGISLRFISSNSCMTLVKSPEQFGDGRLLPLPSAYR